MSLLDTVGATFDKLSAKGLAAPGTLTRTVPGAYDPATGTNAAGTTTTSTCKVVLDASSSSDLGFKFGAGLVRAGDMLALVPAKGLAFAPAPGDTLTVINSIFTVIANRPTYGGATALLHNLLVRA